MTLLPLAVAALLAQSAPPLKAADATGKPAAPAPERIRAVVLPPVLNGKASPGLELVVDEKATALLLLTGKYDTIHFRQVASMAANHMIKPADLGEPNAARKAAERLGAKTFAWATAKSSDKGWELEAFASHVGEAAVEKMTATVPATEAAMVAQTGLLLAQVIAKADKIELPAGGGNLQPNTAKDLAMKSYAACLTGISKQPLGIENPPVIEGEELAKSLQLCEAAVKADPNFSAAWAALALAAAIDNRDQRAVEALGKIDPMANFIPNQTLARFWLVSRFQSPEAGEAVLREAMQREPGFLLAQTYLAELYNRLGRHSDAATVWQDYAKKSPGNTFVISRLAYTLARLGKTEEAVTFSEKALTFDPESPELKLELGSRYIDAGKVDKAIALLTPLASAANPSPDALLRLGYARRLKGDARAAEELFVKAQKAAKDPRGWRVRFRALLDLSALAQEKGDKALAKQRLNEALREGRISYLGSNDMDVLLKLTSLEEAKELQSKVKHPVVQASPLADEKKAPPKGFEKVQVK
jgi:tetratricopeptide (TPR) repeat protein